MLMDDLVAATGIFESRLFGKTSLKKHSHYSFIMGKLYDINMTVSN